MSPLSPGEWYSYNRVADVIPRLEINDFDNNVEDLRGFLLRYAASSRQVRTEVRASMSEALQAKAKELLTVMSKDPQLSEGLRSKIKSDILKRDFYVGSSVFKPTLGVSAGSTQETSADRKTEDTSITSYQHFRAGYQDRMAQDWTLDSRLRLSIFENWQSRDEEQAGANSNSGFEAHQILAAATATTFYSDDPEGNNWQLRLATYNEENNNEFPRSKNSHHAGRLSVQLSGVELGDSLKLRVKQDNHAQWKAYSTDDRSDNSISNWTTAAISLGEKLSVLAQYERHWRDFQDAVSSRKDIEDRGYLTAKLSLGDASYGLLLGARQLEGTQTNSAGEVTNYDQNHWDVAFDTRHQFGPSFVALSLDASLVDSLGTFVGHFLKWQADLDLGYRHAVAGQFTLGFGYGGQRIDLNESQATDSLDAQLRWQSPRVADVATVTTTCSVSHKDVRDFQAEASWQQGCQVAVEFKLPYDFALSVSGSYSLREVGEDYSSSGWSGGASLTWN